MTAYLHGHTIRQFMYHGDRWYAVDNDPQRFATSRDAARWIREHFGHGHRAVAA